MELALKKIIKKMKDIKNIVLLMLFIFAFSSCEKDDDVIIDIPKPTLENLELGLGNSRIGVIGKDFHFNGDIVAGDKIDVVKVSFTQKKGETYSKPWAHEIIWTDYKGLKNTNVHKHFTIPNDAAEGRYVFTITIKDENGSEEVVNVDFDIFAVNNLPIRPSFEALMVFRGSSLIYNGHTNGTPYQTATLKKGDVLRSQVALAFVKGDGKLLMLLIKKSANHTPKTIEEVDISKAVVYDQFEHKDKPEIFRFSNYVYESRPIPDLIIGAEKDNNIPVAQTITGNKAWQTGEYNLVILYKNYTNNSTAYKSIPFNIQME